MQVCFSPFFWALGGSFQTANTFSSSGIFFLGWFSWWFPHISFLFGILLLGYQTLSDLVIVLFFFFFPFCFVFWEITLTYLLTLAFKLWYHIFSFHEHFMFSECLSNPWSTVAISTFVFLINDNILKFFSPGWTAFNSCSFSVVFLFCFVFSCKERVRENIDEGNL